MKEEKKHKQLKWWQGILVVLGLVAAIVLVSMINGLIFSVTRSAISSYVVYAAIIVGAFYCFKLYLQDYAYSFDAHELVCAQVTGTRQKELIRLPISQIEAVLSYAEAKERYQPCHPSRITFDKNENTTVVAYTHKGDRAFIAISVSEKFALALATRVEKLKARKARDEFYENAVAEEEAKEKDIFKD